MSGLTLSPPLSPPLNLKRAWEEDNAGVVPQQQCASAAKRARLLRAHHPSAHRSGGGSSSPAVAGCAAAAYAHAAAAQDPAVAALLAYFPDMDQRTVTGALVDCGNNIDAAIQRLTGLRLHSDDAAIAAAAAATTLPQQSLQDSLTRQNPAGPGMHDTASPLQTQLPNCPPSTAATARDRGADASRASCSISSTSSSTTPADEPAGPQSAEQWVEFLVSEMARSQDLADARVRAAGVLQHFERFVKARSKDEMRVKLGDAQRENAILKRAVQIQNSKLNEKANQEQEIQHLRQMLTQYQEQIHSLELQKYSLTLHLQKATSGSGLGPHNNPDVF